MAWAMSNGLPFAGLLVPMEFLGPFCCISSAQALVIDLFFAALIRPAGVFDWELFWLEAGRKTGLTLSVMPWGTMPGQPGDGSRPCLAFLAPAGLSLSVSTSAVDAHAACREEEEEDK